MLFRSSLTASVGFWATLSLNIPDFSRYARSQRDQVLAMDASRLPPHFLTPPEGADVEPARGTIEQIKQRALRRAEQLSNIYLENADSAVDQSSMELAQKLAAQSIVRLAGLRNIASASASR